MSGMLGIGGAAYGPQIRTAVAPDRVKAEPSRSDATASPEPDDATADQVKRALIGSVFKIDATTDLRTMFGDIEFSESEMAQTAAFLRGLESVRPAASARVEGPRLDMRA